LRQRLYFVKKKFFVCVPFFHCMRISYKAHVCFLCSLNYTKLPADVDGDLH
jgi:hypothetical protein